MSTDLRSRQRELMYAILADEQRYRDWRYRAARPCRMPTVARLWRPRTPVVGDCSKGCQFIDWWTPGSNDPMRQGFGPNGNSQTLWLNLQHLSDPTELKVADIVTMGRDGDEHAAKVLEAGSDPLLWSFGHQGAPNSYRLSWDRRPKQYLRNPLADYRPTHEDLLRARTDWFAWMAWYEGEGDWFHYGPQQPRVRPNVPARIPVAWWKRRAKFLLRRGRGDRPTTGRA